MDLSSENGCFWVKWLGTWRQRRREDRALREYARRVLLAPPRPPNPRLAELREFEAAMLAPWRRSIERRALRARAVDPVVGVELPQRRGLGGQFEHVERGGDLSCGVAEVGLPGQTELVEGPHDRVEGVA